MQLTPCSPCQPEFHQFDFWLGTRKGKLPMQEEASATTDGGKTWKVEEMGSQ